MFRRGLALDLAEDAGAGDGGIGGLASAAVPQGQGVQAEVVEAGDQGGNSVAFVSDRYVLKLFRRVEPTPNPEFEIGRFLTQRGFTRTPDLAGAVQYLRPGLEPGTLAIVQSMVKHQGSGWDFSIDELRRYYERITPRVSGSGGPAFATPDSMPAVAMPDTAAAAQVRTSSPSTEEPPPFFDALEHWYLGSAATLGRRTAELRPAA